MTFHLGGFSIRNALNLENLEEKIQNCDLYWTLLPFFCYTTRMPLFSRISPDRRLFYWLEKFPNYNSFNVLHSFEIKSSYFQIFMNQNQILNTYSTRHLWSWQFATYSPSFYFLSFHQTTTHGTVIDTLHILESTLCIES